MKKFFYFLLLAIAVQGAAAQQNTSFSLIDLPYPTNGLLTSSSCHPKIFIS